MDDTYDSRTRNMMLLGGSILFVAVLLFVSSAVDDSPAKATKRPPPARGPGGVSLVPGAPIGGLEGGSPVPDGGPSVTIIQDIRATMKRLPDRNTPVGAEPYVPRQPAPKRSPGGG